MVQCGDTAAHCDTVQYHDTVQHRDAVPHQNTARHLNLSTPLSTTQLLSEFCGGVFLDPFDAVNLAAVSVSHSTSGCCATSKYIPKFLGTKNSASFFHPPLTTTFNYNQNALESWV